MLTRWFEQPELLWALLGLLPLIVWDIWRTWASGRRRQILGVALRVLIMAGIIVALARPRFETDHEIADVVFVIDRSASIPDSLLERARVTVEEMRANLTSEEQAGLVVFDADPEVLAYPGQEWQLPAQLRTELVTETDLDTALQVALGLVPEAHGGRIMLFTDGRTTTGSARAAVSLAMSRGIPIYTIPIDPGFADPAVASIDLQEPSLRPGETLAGNVVLRGGPEPVSGQLVVHFGDEVILEQTVEIPANSTIEVPIEHSLDPEVEPGLSTLRVDFTPAEGSEDLQIANNVRTQGVNITEPPKVLILASNVEEVENLRDSLDAERIDVEVVASTALSTTPPNFDDYDLVFLGNLPAIATEPDEAFLTEAIIEDLRRYVSAGGGLIVLGGDRAYELGGYGATELSSILPIELRPHDPQIEPAVTMMMVLDNSGSMGSWAEGGTKMDLANAAAVAGMMLLRDFDYLGVAAVDDRVDWVVPLQQVSNREYLERSIRGIPVGGGGIYVYTALREAYRQMRGTTTPLRHVLLFSDTADSEEQVSGIIFGWGPGPNSYDLARAMRSEGITVSVIGIGYDYDQDTGFLRNLADAGGGRFYLTSNASELQSLFVEETQRIIDSVLNETAFRVRTNREHAATAGIEFRRSPRLAGYIQLEPRRTADVILTHPDGHPILTTWQYGLGQVAALAIDAGPRWSAEWLSWDGYSQFWTQLSRWSMRRHEGDDTAIAVDFIDNVATIHVARRTDEGLTQIEGGLRATMQETNAQGLPISAEIPVGLDILEPGLWEAQLATDPDRRYVVNVTDSTGEVFATQTFVAPPSPEFRHEGADQARLLQIAEQTGGSVNPTPEELPPRLSTITDRHPLWLYFLAGSLLLLPIDAFLRRPARDT